MKNSCFVFVLMVLIVNCFYICAMNDEATWNNNICGVPVYTFEHDTDKLFAYAKMGKLEELEKELKKFEVNHQGPLRRTVLHYAVEGGQMEAVRYLVEEKEANVNVKDTLFKECPLHIALRYKFYNIAEYLVEYGADVNEDSDYGLPLNIIAQKGRFVQYGADILEDVKNNDIADLEMAQLLIEKGGAHVNNVHEGFYELLNETPLQTAVNYNQFELACYLIKEKKAVVNLKNGGAEPLSIAILRKNKKMIELLVEEGSAFIESDYISDERSSNDIQEYLKRKLKEKNEEESGCQIL